MKTSVAETEVHSITHTHTHTHIQIHTTVKVQEPLLVVVRLTTGAVCALFTIYSCLMIANFESHSFV